MCSGPLPNTERLSDSHFSQSPRQRLKKEEQAKRQAQQAQQDASSSQARPVQSTAEQPSPDGALAMEHSSQQPAQPPARASPPVRESPDAIQRQSSEDLQQLESVQTELERGQEELLKQVQDLENKISEVQGHKHDLVLKLKQV